MKHLDQIANAMNIKVESMPAAASYTANGAAVAYGALSLNEWLALLGAVLAVATFVLNLRYQRRREARERRQEERARELHSLQVMNQNAALNRDEQ